MKRKVPTETIVKFRETYDSLSLTIKYPSGATFKYKINRSGEDLEMAFSNNPTELKQQLSETRAWINTLTGTNFERIKHIEAILGKAKSGREAIELMRALSLIHI